MNLTIDPPDSQLASRLTIHWVGIALSQVECVTCKAKFYARTGESREPILDGHNLAAVRAHVLLCKRHLDKPHGAV